MDRDGANHRFLTDGSNLVLTPRFSPSSQEITYLSYINEQPRVYLYNIDTGQQEVLGEFPGMTFAPRFSPDGNTVIMSLATGGNSEIYTQDLRTRVVKQLAEKAKTAFIPQCGLAPGFVSIVAYDLVSHFDTLQNLHLRVGALPQFPSNALKYNLTWSTDGLINEYGNVCYGIEGGVKIPLLPLEGHETIEVDGLLYEAFNTSGGLGTLADTYTGKVQTMNYKTLRYPGHCEKIQFLMNDLKLNKQREILKHILENAIPKTLQDVVLIYVAVIGRKGGELLEENYVKKIYPQTISGKIWSAIQVTTAASLCSVVDLVFANPIQHQGFITQETFSLQSILSNRFGKYFV